MLQSVKMPNSFIPSAVSFPSLPPGFRLLVVFWSHCCSEALGFLVVFVVWFSWFEMQINYFSSFLLCLYSQENCICAHLLTCLLFPFHWGICSEAEDRLPLQRCRLSFSGAARQILAYSAGRLCALFSPSPELGERGEQSSQTASVVSLRPHVLDWLFVFYGPDSVD